MNVNRVPGCGSGFMEFFRQSYAAQIGAGLQSLPPKKPRSDSVEISEAARFAHIAIQPLGNDQPPSRNDPGQEKPPDPDDFCPS
jgi:hypothetical protein